MSSCHAPNAHRLAHVREPKRSIAWVSNQRPSIQSHACLALRGGRDADQEPDEIAEWSIHIASHTCPSGSARFRLYMNPRSCFGLMSAVPPCLAAATFIVSTASLVGQDTASIT